MFWSCVRNLLVILEKSLHLSGPQLPNLKKKKKKKRELNLITDIPLKLRVEILTVMSSFTLKILTVLNYATAILFMNMAPSPFWSSCPRKQSIRQKFMWNGHYHM